MAFQEWQDSLLSYPKQTGRRVATKKSVANKSVTNLFQWSFDKVDQPVFSSQRSWIGTGFEVEIPGFWRQGMEEKDQ